MEKWSMKKKADFSKDAVVWLDFASYDLKTAKWEFEGKIYTSSCYAAQQTAEKALKALIWAKGKVIPKVHSLDRLVSELKKLNIAIFEIEEEAKQLDKYYISARYPGQYGGPEGLYDESDGLSAITPAEKILKFVKRHF